MVHLDEIVIISEEKFVTVTADGQQLVIEPEQKFLEIQPGDKNVVVQSDEKLVSVSAPGPPGPPGPTGPAAGEGIVYSQSTPAASWPITHNLHRPVGTVIVLDSGEEVWTQIDQGAPDFDTVVIIFPAPTTGKVLVI